MYQRILVPIDGSEAGERGLKEATGLARALGARVHLVHVINKTPWLYTGTPPEVIDLLLDQLRSTGETIIHEATTALRAAGIEVDHRLIEAPGERAGEFICAEAKDWPAELIVCGTHGVRGLKRVLMGSDAEYIVSHSPVPVLLVRGLKSSPA